MSSTSSPSGKAKSSPPETSLPLVPLTVSEGKGSDGAGVVRVGQQQEGKVAEDAKEAKDAVEDEGDKRDQKKRDDAEMAVVVQALNEKVDVLQTLLRGVQEERRDARHRVRVVVLVRAPHEPQCVLQLRSTADTGLG